MEQGRKSVEMVRVSVGQHDSIESERIDPYLHKGLNGIPRNIHKEGKAAAPD